jgi:hypothetical protein
MPLAASHVTVPVGEFRCALLACCREHSMLLATDGVSAQR